MSDVYYVKRNGKLFGPYDYEQVTNCIRKDIFSSSDQISKDKVTWMLISEFLKELKTPKITPPVVKIVPQAPLAGQSIPLQQPQMQGGFAGNMNPAAPLQYPNMPNNGYGPMGGAVPAPVSVYSDFNFKMALEGAVQRASTTFWIAHIIWLVIFAIGFIGGLFGIKELIMVEQYTSWIYYVAYLVFFVFGLIALYHAWKVLPPNEASTSPGFAVGFLFIPLFNLYWIFVAFYSLASCLNRKCRNAGMMPVASESGAITMCCLYISSWVANLVLSVVQVAEDIYWTSAERALLHVLSILFVVFGMFIFGLCLCSVSKAAVRMYRQFEGTNGMPQSQPGMMHGPQYR